MYKSEHLAKENIRVVHKHIKNTQNHISLGNYKLKQQWSIAPHLLEPVNSKKRRKKNQRIHLPMQETQVRALIREKSHMPQNNLVVFFPKLNKAHMSIKHACLVFQKRLWKSVQTKTIMQLCTAALLVIAKNFQISGCFW